MKELEVMIAYKFKDPQIFKEALTHKSSKLPYNNERLEFLGDAVMDLIVGEYLYKKFAKIPEGELSKLRAALVNEKSFAKLACSINLGRYLSLSLAESNNGGREKPSILSDAFEALMGAIYLEAGLETVRKIAISLLETAFPQIDSNTLIKDYKTKLQEMTQASMGMTPVYELVRSFGPDHKKEFEIALLVNDKEISRAVGKSKKEAQQLAAKQAIDMLENL